MRRETVIMKGDFAAHEVCVLRAAGRSKYRKSAGNLTAALVATTALVFPGMAHAAEQSPPAATAAPQPAADNGGLQEIIVTAQKRFENLQKVPIAVVAITAKDAAIRGLTGTQALTAAIPGLIITSPANVGNPYLRGVGSNLFDPSAEQGVAMYVDGVYIAAPQSTIFNFNNIQDVQVLYGPQGTLFGRNATGGVIQITTMRPSATPHLDLNVGYGNYQDVTASGYLAGGLAPNLTADFAALYENQGKGFGRNLTLNRTEDQQAVGNISLRSKVVFQPAPDTTFTLSGDYAHTVSTNAYQKPQGVISPIDGTTTYPGPFNSTNDHYNRDQVETGGVSLRYDQKIGSLTLMNLISYRKTKVKYDLDNDVTNLPVVNVRLDPSQHNISEELQLSGPDSGKFKWIVGAYYFNSVGAYDDVAFFLANGSSIPIPYNNQQKAISYAGFGQATLEVAPATELTAGLRYTTETQSYSQTYPAPAASVPTSQPAQQTFNKLTWRLALKHDFTDDISAYASYNRGFKSGGYNLRLPGNAFLPETLDAYEVGIKTELFDRHLRLNVDGFFYNDKNVQVLTSVLGGTFTTNAAAAHIKGIEASFEGAITREFHVSGGISVQHGEYTSYPNGPRLDQNGQVLPSIDLTGNQTIVTPPESGTITASYNLDLGNNGRLQPSVTYVYNAGFFWQPDNRLTQPAYSLVNASLLWTSASKQIDARLWVKNLTNATYYVARLGVKSLGDVQEQAAPRTFGITVGVHLQ